MASIVCEMIYFIIFFILLYKLYAKYKNKIQQLNKNKHKKISNGKI